MDEVERARRVIADVHRIMALRIRALLDLPLADLEPERLGQELQEIGERG